MTRLTQGRTRSLAWTLYDVALFVTLVAPIAVVAAVAAGRTKAALIYAAILLLIDTIAYAVSRRAGVSIATYLRSFHA